MSVHGPRMSSADAPARSSVGGAAPPGRDAPAPSGAGAVEAAGTRAPLRTLIVGAGVAALEAALELRELADGRVTVTLLAPEPAFVYRPLRVREPFALGATPRYPLAEIAQEIGAEFEQDALKWLDPVERVVHTEGGAQLAYDALLLAPGARKHSRFAHALTLDDRRLDEQMHGVLQDVEEGRVHKLAFIVPAPPAWPLPLYELALMLAGRAWDSSQEVSITFATPEDAPLAIFGTEVQAAVQRVLEQNGIEVIASAYCDTPEPGVVAIHPGDRTLRVDRVIALPELFGPAIPGVPKRGPQGFIPVDPYCRVPDVERVWAAGDATEFAVKHGGIAAQQADVAAASIAALAGAPVDPVKFHPVIHAVLLGGDHPLYLSAHITGGHGSSSRVSDQPDWSPPTKIAAKRLAAFLQSREQAAHR
jgi:sulfide:quinone oxidoreductase